MRNNIWLGHASILDESIGFISITYYCLFYFKGTVGNNIYIMANTKKKSQKWATSRKMTRQKQRHDSVEDEEIGKGNQIFDS